MEKLCHPKRKVFPSRNILRSPGDNTLHHRSSPPCRRSFRGTLFRPLYVVTNSKLANCPRGVGRQGWVLNPSRKWFVQHEPIWKMFCLRRCGKFLLSAFDKWWNGGIFPGSTLLKAAVPWSSLVVRYKCGRYYMQSWHLSRQDLWFYLPTDLCLSSFYHGPESPFPSSDSAPISYIHGPSRAQDHYQ